MCFLVVSQRSRINFSDLSDEERPLVTADPHEDEYAPVLELGLEESDLEERQSLDEFYSTAELDDDNAETEAWGSKRRNFYSNDRGMTVEEEELEVLRLQQKRLQGMSATDFLHPQLPSDYDENEDVGNGTSVEHSLCVENESPLVVPSKSKRNMKAARKAPKSAPALENYKEKLLKLAYSAIETPFAVVNREQIVKECEASSNESPLEYYESLANMKTCRILRDQEKKEQLRRSAIPSYDAISDKQDDEPRPVPYSIIKNKGLLPTRTKIQRNPRVKQRTRFEKANKRIKGVKPMYNMHHPQRGATSYAGELSGIKGNLVKSIKFNH